MLATTAPIIFSGGLPLGNPESAAGFVLILEAFKPNTTALYMGEKRVRVNSEKTAVLEKKENTKLNFCLVKKLN